MVKEAPWGKSGLLDYPDAGYEYVNGKHERVEIDWRPNEPFLAFLELVDTYKRRSAAGFVWKSQDTGDLLPMFLSEMLRTVKSRPIVGGVVSGEWHVVKRGSNYGIALV